MAKDFRELFVWEQAMVLAEQVYGMTRQLPRDERFGLVAQMRRAAVSVPSCIAEGNSRATTPDYLRFLSMAAGSLSELRTQVQLCARLGFASSDATDAAEAQAWRVAQLLQKLQNSLRRAHRDAREGSPSRFPVPGSPS